MSLSSTLAGTVGSALKEQGQTAALELGYQEKATEINTIFKTLNDTMQSMQKMNGDAADGAKYQ